jgi:hypothetical protein
MTTVRLAELGPAERRLLLALIAADREAKEKARPGEIGPAMEERRRDRRPSRQR